MGNLTLYYVLAVLTASGVIQCISVVGPRVLRPYGSYRVSIAGGSRAHNLYVAVEGRKSNGEQFTQGREVQIQAGTSSLIGLDIGDPGPGKYSLVARSTSGPQFSSSAPLMYQPRSFCIFVQTDKRVYQPGDTISFRVIALDKYLLPLTNTVDVSILDTGGSPIRQWATVPLDRGVFADEILLADEPALGEWTIQVEIRGQTYSKKILIADYVLPRFQMDMQMPKEILFTDGRFNVNVSAKHFDGLPVQGELTISAYAVFFSGVLQPVFSTPARKVVEFDGNTNIVYDLKTDLDLAEDAARPLVVEAVIEEKDTLIRQNISSRILLLRAPYRLKVTAPNYFKPELPYTVQIELVNSTGHALNTDGEVTVERLWDDGAPINITAVPLKGGFATYTLTPDKAHMDSTLNLLIRYKEVTERVVNVQKMTPADGQFLTIELLTRDSAVGDEMRARITATEPMDLVHYVVIGRGDILVAKTVELSPARRSVDVKEGVSARMAPGCVVLAWYPRAAAAAPLLAAAVYAPQRRLLQHQVSVQPVSPTLSYRPNGLVEFRVSGEAGAFAGLLGSDVDAVKTGLNGREGLGSGLDMHAIEREVESFSGLQHRIFKNEDFIAGLGLDLGGKTAADVFQNAGVVILTDGLVIANNNPDSSVTETVPETGTRAPLAGPYAFSRLPPPPSPRFYLTMSPHNTWMFTNLTIGNDGKGTRERWSPIRPGEWCVGAFAVHPTLGLGLAEPQKFITSVPLSITAELPETLQKGEILAVVVTLKSTLPVDTSVEVTFHNSDQYYEFEPLENTVDSTKKIELFKRTRVSVPARGSASTAFLVSAARAGEAPIIVEATGSGVSASLFRTIDVKEGYEEEVWSWTLLDGRSGVARGNVSVAAAAGTRLGGAALEACGDPLAPAARALTLPPAPAADAVYALRPLARACVMLDYLQITEQDDEQAITKEARAQIATGYQRLMAFRQPDGSFSQETGDNAEGDVWMTAEACRWLWRATRYLSVSPAAATGAARWLAAMQTATGGWDVPAVRDDPRAQSPVPLAAHALLALLATKGSDVLHKNAINKAVDFIAQRISEDLDAYSLAVAASALSAAQHPLATRALEMMDQYANITESTLFWSRRVSGNEWRNPWLRGDSVSLRTAAWAARALLAARLQDRIAPVARYLLQNLPPTDHDPDVLDSLAQYAALIKSTTKLRISVNVTGFEEPRQFNIDNDNAFIIQTQLIRLRSNSAQVRAVTEGRGVAALGLQARGVTNVTAAWPRYTLDPRVDHVSTHSRLQLSVCTGYVAQGNETESGLALLVVQLPSGYLADINTITELTSARHVSGARLQRGGARVASWVRVGRGEACATLAAPRALPTAAQRPGWATIQDLYDSSHRARVFFQPVASTACDVCRAWPSCERACGAAALQRAPDARSPAGAAPAAPDSASHNAPFTSTLTVAALITVAVQFLL